MRNCWKTERCLRLAMHQWRVTGECKHRRRWGGELREIMRNFVKEKRHEVDNQSRHDDRTRFHCSISFFEPMSLKQITKSITFGASSRIEKTVIIFEYIVHVKNYWLPSVGVSGIIIAICVWWAQQACFACVEIALHSSQKYFGWLVRRCLYEKIHTMHW